MKKLTLLALIGIFSVAHSGAQYAQGDSWRTNPLGFEPLGLHTRMGFILPAAAAGIILLTTKSYDGAEVSFFDTLGYSRGYKYPETNLFQNNVGVNYQVRKYLSIGAEFSWYRPFDDFNGTDGFGLRPFARFFFLSGSRLKLYFESGGGIIGFLDEFPKPTDRDGRLGTFINGTTKYGLGGEIAVSDEISVILGVQHVHVSNGNTLGAERNPSHDSNGGFLGIAYSFSSQ